MKNTIKFLLLFGICTASHCGKREDTENCHRAIKFYNDTEKSLYARCTHQCHLYTDPFDINYLSYTVEAPVWYKVNSGEENRKASEVNRCIELDFGNGVFYDTLWYFVFDAAIVENTPWEVVARDYLVLKRYDLTLKDLQRLDWKITYPPTETMKDVKQYPPYGE